MPKIVQINECLNSSTGKIARQIGDTAILKGWDSVIAYSAWEDEYPCKSKLVTIGTKYDRYFHAIESRLFDNHGLASRKATRKLIREIESIRPDVIHLHLVHGYYLNYKVLFSYLKVANIPVVWTFHDCWAFTGHCGFFFSQKDGECDKWKNGCHDCKLLKEYPQSLFVDRTKRNWSLKREVFCSLDKLTIVPVCDWMDGLVKKSFLAGVTTKRIYNGIDVNQFAPQGEKSEVFKRLGIKNGCRLILGVANVWEERKGLGDFCYLAEYLPSNVAVVLVGLDKRVAKKSSNKIIGIERTESIQQLAELYSAADIFVNPTYGDNFPTTNLEALACGTPVVTYNTGGSPEAVDEYTGIVVERGCRELLQKATERILNEWDLTATSHKCRERAISLYDQSKNFDEYVSLYNSLMDCR